MTTFIIIAVLLFLVLMLGLTWGVWAVTEHLHLLRNELGYINRSSMDIVMEIRKFWSTDHKIQVNFEQKKEKE